MTARPTTTWKNAILEHHPELRLEGEIAITSVVDPEGEAAYWDIDYESILQDPYRTVTAENPFYMRAIADAYAQAAHAASDGPMVADLGCGDGRFTREFLELGCPRIVALDISPRNLLRLSQRIAAIPGASDRVLLVEGDVAVPPLPKGHFDLVLAAGVLCVLKDRYHEGVRACRDLVRPGGYLLVFDPIDFGSVMYALVRHHLQELRTVLAEGTKTVDIADPNAHRVAVRSVREMVQAHERAGLRICSVTGIPLFPSLLFGGVKQMIPPTADDLRLMRDLNDALTERFPDLWRAACILSQRPEAQAQRTHRDTGSPPS
ncbi:MAG: class I SAM-dependent methyltransferase [Isosphaeraceae bacterium]|nr:class I SAM-dependent methyltransferase [Isosphaeraceae bacterium]